MASVKDLQEDTAFEHAVVRAVTPLLGDGDTPTHTIDLRHPSAPTVVRSGDQTGAAEADRLTRALRPLLFGASWKILDLLVEHALASDGQTPPGRGGRWRIDTKAECARAGGLKSVPPFDTVEGGPTTWTAITHLYAGTEQLRHTLVHRTSQVRENGDLRADRHDGVVQILTAKEQVSFCRAVLHTIDAVIGGAISTRHRNDLRWNLHQLRRHSGVPLSDGAAAHSLCEIVTELAPDGGRVALDIPALRAAAAERCQVPDGTVFNLVACLPGQATALVGELETVPEEAVSFDLAAPPSWLRLELRAD
jgi:hypothetical protein